jgi:hypothetical protein
MVGRNTEKTARGCRKLNNEAYYIPVFLINKKNGLGGEPNSYRPDDKGVKEFGKSEGKRLVGRYMHDGRKIS